jgi:phosphopantetheine--protein transferase-like protein
MNNEIKNILAQFLKIDSSQVTNDSIIDKTAIGGSIMVHRLYANLAGNGFQVKDYLRIKTVGQLLDQISGRTTDSSGNDSIGNNTDAPLSDNSVGIDIELIDNLPQVFDFRSDPFYQSNFSPYEISYCLMKENPRASFAGLFAAKEAICKIDFRLGRQGFNQIEIGHTNNGRPFYNSFSLSISHTDEYAIAVASYILMPDSKLAMMEFPVKDVSRDVENLCQENKSIRRTLKVVLTVTSLLFVSLIALYIFTFILH